MPIFEYKCQSCGAHFEELVPVLSLKKPKCPKCGNKDTRRKMSAFSFGGGNSGGRSCNTGG